MADAAWGLESCLNPLRVLFSSLGEKINLNFIESNY
jgi:hypothetical protein